jgi:hypothetical protein
MARTGRFDHASLSKYGLLTGVALFGLGAVGELFVRVAVGDPPAWENTLLVGMEASGIVIAMVSVFVVGILLPLLE